MKGESEKTCGRDSSPAHHPNRKDNINEDHQCIASPRNRSMARRTHGPYHRHQKRRTRLGTLHPDRRGKLVAYRDKALEQAKKAKTPDKANEYYSKAQGYDIKITEAEAKNKRLKVGVDFWKFLAELWAEPADGEPPMERGHRLEPENIQITLKTLGLTPAIASPIAVSGRVTTMTVSLAVQTPTSTVRSRRGPSNASRLAPPTICRR